METPKSHFLVTFESLLVFRGSGVSRGFQGSQLQQITWLRCSTPWPFFSQELCRKTHILGAILKDGQWDPRTEGGIIAENRTLTDVNRRYFRISGRFSAVNRRQCRRFPAKKGPGKFTPNIAVDVVLVCAPAHVMCKTGAWCNRQADAARAAQGRNGCKLLGAWCWGLSHPRVFRKRADKGISGPWSSLLFGISLLFLLQGTSLLFGAFFPSFPGILGVQHGEKILAFLAGFPCFFQKMKESKIRGGSLKITSENRNRVWSKKQPQRLLLGFGRRARFQTPNSLSFLALTEFRGESSVSSSQSFICVPKRTHRVLCRTHQVCRRTQWVLSPETVS